VVVTTARTPEAVVVTTARTPEAVVVTTARTPEGITTVTVAVHSNRPRSTPEAASDRSVFRCG